jgi:hypothetical protein
MAQGLPDYFLASPSGGVVNLHDLTYSPLALWQLDWSLADSSGNGYTLTQNSQGWGHMPNGVKAGFFRDSTYFSHAYNAALAITGEITVEVIAFLVDNPTNDLNICSFGVTGESLASNVLWSLGVDGTKGALRYFAEYGSAGTNIVFDSGNYSVPASQVVHLAMTRSSSQIINLYINGYCVGTSSALHAPEGGTSDMLKIGDGTTSTERGTMVASVKVIAAELSAAQIKGEAFRCLGFVLT